MFSRRILRRSARNRARAEWPALRLRVLDLI
jgi:hypothetical protein